MRQIIFVALIIFWAGCASEQAGKVLRVDPREIQDTDANYGVEDLHLFVHKMVSSMLQSLLIATEPKKYLALGDIKIGSGVDEHIDILLIKNSIRTNLIKSTKINFIDTEYLKKLNGDQGIVKDFLLSGDLHAIKKDNRKAVDNFYALTLILTDVKTSEIVWTEEKEIRKMILK